MSTLAGRQYWGVITLQGQGGVIEAAWLTAAGHGRWAGSPRGPGLAVAEVFREDEVI